MIAQPIAAQPTKTTLVSDEGYLVREMTTLSSGSATAIYSALGSDIRQVHIVQSILVTNPTAGIVSALVQVYRAANATSYEFYPATNLASKGRLPFPTDNGSDLGLLLEAGDELRLTGNGLTAIVMARVYQGNVK